MIPDWALYIRWRDTFEQVMDERYYTIDWLDGRILDGSARFWGTKTAAIVAEIREYPTGAKDVHGLIAAGEMPEIVEGLIPQAEQWGREQGCIGAVIESRHGWSRVLDEYHPFQVSVRKDL